MLLKFLLSLIVPFQFYAVDPGEGAASAPAAADAIDSAGSSSADESPSLQEAVIEELGIEEGKDGIPGDEVAIEGADAKPEIGAEKPEALAQPKPDDGKSKEITAADLEPLNSKNPSTNERFSKLTEGYKSEKARADQLHADVERLSGSIDSLRQLGFTDEAAAHDLVEFSGYRHTLASGDAEAFSKIIGQQIKTFELMHGKRISLDVTGLSEFPDLAEAVSNLQLTEAHALEIARSRTSQLQQRVQRDNQYQAQRNEQQQQQLLQEVVGQVEELQANWMATDPDYQAILPHLQPLMTKIAQSFPPQQWIGAIKLQYDSLKSTLASTRQVPGREQTPLRGNANLSAKPVPQSAEQAVLQDLGLE